jgi:pyruvate,water dikinase
MAFSQLFKHWTLELFSPGKLIRRKYAAFKELLRYDKRSLELITDLEDVVNGPGVVDWARVASLVRALIWSTGCMVGSLVAMHPRTYRELEERFHQIESALMSGITLPDGDTGPPYTITLTEAAHIPELAGGKASTLSRMLQQTGLPGPRGFVVTTGAFRCFLKHNDLRHRLDELLSQVDLADWLRLAELSQEMTGLVQTGAIPPAVAREIAGRLEDFRRGDLEGPWALRSSALSEDGEASFAGQYHSILAVATHEIPEAYKQVLASKYSPAAVAYRIRNGLSDQETPMAVLVLEMIDAVMSGVVYTRSPLTDDPAEACVEVFAQTGLGRRLMDGDSLPEVHYFSHEVDPKPLRSPSVTPRQEGMPRLASETALELARWGMKIEEMAGRPQDIEWCQDDLGNIHLLQSRPLNIGSIHRPNGEAEPQSLEIVNPILLEGGVTASAGLGTGPVSLVIGQDDLANVPEGAVLVSPTLLPAFAAIIQKLSAAVADQGSRASHFAMVAREYGLPVIVAAREATRLLPPGRTVTVHAGQCRVFLGEVETLKSRQALAPTTVRATPLAARLQDVIKYVLPLHLTDPAAPSFGPHRCQSLHDLVRFSHEQGMAEMFSLVGRHGRGLTRARRLDTDLPLIMYVLDLGGGIAPEAGRGKLVSPRFFVSEPMRACWRGLSHPDITWHKGLLHIDWEQLDRISSGLISLRSSTLASYAIISEDYHHLVLRFGYHFAVLDALCGQDPEANYIAFRFKGGGGSFENRLRRIRLIRSILEWAEFTVQTRGDLLDARFQRREARQILSRLTLMGLLQGKTLLLDMALNSDEQVDQWVEDFMQRYREYVTD